MFLCCFHKWVIQASRVIFSEYRKMGWLWSLLFTTVIISGCNEQHSESERTVVTSQFHIKAPLHIDFSPGVSTKMKMNVKPVKAMSNKETGRKTLEASGSDADEYSVRLAENSTYHVTKNLCTHIPIGNECVLYITPGSKWSATNPGAVRLNIELQGEAITYIVYPEITPLLLNITKSASFPLNKTNYIVITNTSTKETFYFDKVQFHSESGADKTDLADTGSVTVSNTDCISTLLPGKSCSLNIKSGNTAYGELKLENEAADIARMGFEPLNIKAEAIEDIPENTALGATYHFTYLFTNTSTGLDADNVHFRNSFPPDEGFTLDYQKSDCDDIEKTGLLKHNSSCTWTGTFTPESIGQNKEAESTITYLESSAVSVVSKTSVSKVVVESEIQKNLPVNTDSGTTYQFAYKFTNRSTLLPATGIRFINSFPAEKGVHLDYKASTCNGIYSLKPGESCFWAGSFKAGEKNTQADISSVLSYDQGANTKLASHTYITDVEVMEEIIEDLDTYSAPGGVYRFTYKFVNTNPHLSATNVEIIKNYPENQKFTLDEDIEKPCTRLPLCPSPHGDTHPESHCLKPQDYCILTGEYTASKTNDDQAVISTLFKYDEGKDISFAKETTIKEVKVEAKPLNPGKALPEHALKGKSYPFDYRFVNVSDENVSAVNIDFKDNLVPEGNFVLDDNGDESCDKVPGHQLTQGQECAFSGVFEAKGTEEEPDYSALLDLKMTYNNGNGSASVFRDMFVTHVNFDITPFSNASAIPKSVAAGLTYDFVYEVKNTNAKVSATDIDFYERPSAADGFIIDYGMSTCFDYQGRTMPAGYECTWEGKFKPVANTTPVFNIRMRYTEGESELFDPSETINVTKVVLDKQEVSTIPENSIKEFDYPFAYKITNNNDHLAANDITFQSDPIANFEVKFKQPGDTSVVNNCLSKTNLDVRGDFCMLEGTIRAKQSSTVKRLALNIRITYREGTHQSFSGVDSISEDTTVDDLAINGSKEPEIQPNTAKGVTYYFTYRFTNDDTKVPATGVSFTPEFMPADGFTLYRDSRSSCNGITELKEKDASKPGQNTCVWKGEFTPQADTPTRRDVKITMDYNQGSAKVEDYTNVTTVSVTATANPGIPNDVGVGITYPFSYTFTNTNTKLDATGISYSSNLEQLANQTGEIVVDKDECKGKSKLIKGESCVVEGSLTPATPSGSLALSATMAYAEGSNPADINEPTIRSSGFETMENTKVKNGDIFLNESKEKKKGGYVSKYQLDLSKPLNVDFDYRFGDAVEDGGMGIAFVIHNDPGGNHLVKKDDDHLNTRGLKNGAAILLEAKDEWSTRIRLVATESFSTLKDENGNKIDKDLNQLYDGITRHFKIEWEPGKCKTCKTGNSCTRCLTIFTNTSPSFKRETEEFRYTELLQGTKGWIDFRSATGDDLLYYLYYLKAEHKIKNIVIHGTYAQP